LVINHLQQNFSLNSNNAVVFLYCDYQTEYSVIQLLEAILKQLAQHHLTSDVLDSLAKHKEKKSHPTVDELMVILQSEIKTYHHFFVVVDALDECSDRIRLDFVKRLQALSASIIITSQNLADISKAFKQEAHLEIIGKSEDMRAYIKDTIYNNETIYRLVNKAPPLWHVIAEKVVETAGGM
jgi:hypothetical protein